MVSDMDLRIDWVVSNGAVVRGLFSEVTGPPAFELTRCLVVGTRFGEQADVRRRLETFCGRAVAMGWYRGVHDSSFEVGPFVLSIANVRPKEDSMVAGHVVLGQGDVADFLKCYLQDRLPRHVPGAVCARSSKDGQVEIE